MQVTIGKDGLECSCQEKHPETTECCRCGGVARIGFVAYDDEHTIVADLYDNEGGRGGDFWLHDSCTVAVYFCTKCLETTALYNQY